MKNGMYPKYLVDKIQIVQSVNEKTRQMENLVIDGCKTKEEQKMLLYVGFKMFNKLPNELKSEGRIQNFNRLLAKYIK